MSLELLEQKIVKHSTDYYEFSNSSISDADFDALLEELRNIEPDHPLLSQVGWGAKIRTDTAHLYGLPQGILDRRVLENYAHISAAYVLSLKLDGGSILAYYEDGYLIKAVTRGQDNGEGKDCTANLVKAGVLPTMIKNKEIQCVRGEAVCSYEAFDKIGGKSARNKANGICNKDNPTKGELEALSFIAYSIVSVSSDFERYTDYSQHLVALSQCGFFVVKYEEFDNEQTVHLDGNWDMNDRDNSRMRGETWPVDGAVACDRTVNVDSNGKCTFNLFALKYPDDSYETTVREIEYNASSKTTKITPVAIYDPVEVPGATLSRATLNNYEWMRSRGIGVGSVIRIVRSKEIIPMWVETVKSVDVTPIEELDGIPVFHEGDNLYVSSVEVLNVQLYYTFISKAPKGFGRAGFDTFLERIIENYPDTPRTYSGLIDMLLNCSLQGLELTKTQIGYITGTRDNFNSQGVDAGDILEYAYISGNADSASQAAREQINSTHLMAATLENEIQLIYCTSGRNSTAQDNINESTAILLEITESLKPYIRQYIKPEEVVSKLTICMTGTLSTPRKELAAELKLLGYLEASSAKCDVLITDSTRESSKMKQAKARNIPVMTEADFRSKYVCQ